MLPRGLWYQPSILPMRGALVGRERELRAIERVLEVAQGGRAARLLFAGEAGIGKSTLVQRAAERGAELGFDVAWGRSWEAGGAPAYWPWTQILRDLRGCGERAASPRELDRLLPELGAETARSSPISPEERFVLSDAAVRYLHDASEKKPILLILEDLHAADPATLQLLDFIAAHLHSGCLAILGTYRILEAQLVPAVSSLIDGIARRSEVLEPAPLSRAQITDLVTSRSGPTDETLINWLFDTSEGNPLFVTELGHVIANRRDDSAMPPLPQGLRSTIRAHLRAIPIELAPTLEIAATVGRDLSAGLLAEVSKASPDVILEQLDLAVRLGVLVERGSGRFAFAHGLIAETLRQDLSPRRRSELHRAIAEVLSRTRRGTPAAPLAEIAHHLFEAGPSESARAVIAAEEAADRALRQVAFEQAASLIDRALVRLDDIEPPDLTRRVKLLLLLAEARVLGGADEECRRLCREAADLARGLVDTQLFARSALGYGRVFTFGETDPVLVTLLREALAMMPEADDPLRARLLARLGAALQPCDDPIVPIDIARSGIEMARRLGDARTKLEVFHTASAALAHFTGPHERHNIDREALSLAMQLGESALVPRARLRLAFDAAELGEMTECLVQVEAYERLVRDFRQPRASWPSLMVRAMCALFEGRFADQEALVARCAALFEASTNPLVEACLFVHQLMTARARGHHEEQLRLARGVFGLVPTDVAREVMCASAEVRLGRLDEARARMASLGPKRIIQGMSAAMGSFAAEVVAALRDEVQADALYEWLRPMEGRNAGFVLHGAAIEGPVARSLFLLAATLGRFDDARGHAQRALEAMRRQGGRPLEALISIEWAEILIDRGVDADEAKALLERARSLNDVLGLAWKTRIDAAERGLQRSDRPRRDSIPPQTNGPAIELVREGEYWTCSGFGELARIKHSRGLEMLSKLLAEPGREISALDLAGGDGAVDAGDASEAIDEEAKRAYRTRLLELEQEIDQAEDWNDRARAERLSLEAEALRKELARALGLSGRVRRTGGAAERARVNAQRRIADVVRRVREAAPTLGAHLQVCVRTGTYCSYHPERAGR